MICKRSKKFDKDVLAIKDLSLIKEISKTLKNINDANDIKDIKNVKKIVEFKNAYRIKVKTYRICFYFYSDNVIELERFSHRKDAYNNFP